MTTDEIKALLVGATPVPWGIDPAYISEVNAPNGLTVASCWHRQCEGASITVSGINPVSPEESAANARLIAAAPDLAALALRQAEEIARLRRAIAAADGYIDRGHYEMARNITRAALASTEAAE